MATPFRVDLITPDRSLFGGEADEVSMRTVIGEITFLARHEDFVGAADSTVVRIHVVGSDSGEEGSDLRVAMHGGVVHVSEEGLLILARLAELASEIDVERARRALSAAEGRLAEEGEARREGGESEQAGRPGAPFDTPQAELDRARTRLEAAGAEAAA